MAKYFYRFDTSTELGCKFRQFVYECDKANRAADSYCAKIGASTFYEEPTMFAGGVLCVGFADPDKVDKKLWRSVGKDADGFEMWEPNCQQRIDAFLLPRRDFRPCDTQTRVCEKKPCRWIDVVNLHTKEEWMKTAGLTPTDNPQKDWAATCAVLEKEYFVKYIELYIDDEQREQSANKRYRMPLWMKRAMQLEHQRLKLPVVSVKTLYSLLQADFTNGDDDKPKVVQGVTPIYFLLNGYYYVSCGFKCLHQDLEAVTEEKFLQRKNDFEWEMEKRKASN